MFFSLSFFFDESFVFLAYKWMCMYIYIYICRERFREDF